MEFGAGKVGATPHMQSLRRFEVVGNMHSVVVEGKEVVGNMPVSYTHLTLPTNREV